MRGSEFGSNTFYALMKFSIKKAKEFKPETKETWCVKVPTTKPEHLSLMLKIRTVQGES